MGKQLLHTPEGVRDICGEEYARKMVTEGFLHAKMKSFGFQDIQTPTFEFFDVFSKEIGTTPSKDLYKFFDKEGNTLVLRPDFTPSIARCAAKYFMEENIPVRLCYQGNTFTNTSNLQGKLKEVTQMGAELIGDPGVEADAEMIALVAECLLTAGLKEFQISVGEVEFFKGLCEEAGIDEEMEWELRDLISGRNVFGAQELLENAGIDVAHREAILRVTDQFMTPESLQEAKQMAHNARSLGAIKRLDRLYELLACYGVDSYVTFDLAMLSKYHYYTGVIFKAYTYGVGDAIVKGGRYDTLLSRFGKPSSAIGAVIVVDDLLAALSGQKLSPVIERLNTLVLYHRDYAKEAIGMVRGLRGAGRRALLVPEPEGAVDYHLFAGDPVLKSIIHIHSREAGTLVQFPEGVATDISMEGLLS